MSSEIYTEMEFAKPDLSRKERTGFAEVIFAQGKEDDFLCEIFKKLYEQNGSVMATRATEHQAKLIKAIYPKAVYDNVSRIIRLADKPEPLVGSIAVCTAGTADIKVAEECAVAAEFFGTKVERVYDVGVSGIHRILSKTDVLNKVNCVVAIAGMEGALASVIGGLCSVPVIAVPTSVGYGASFEGLSALLTMINSCANGISVVNIDNGYGAAYIATQINRLAVKGSVK